MENKAQSSLEVGADEIEESDNSTCKLKPEVLKREVPDFSKCRSAVYQHFKWDNELRLWKCKDCLKAYEHKPSSGGSALTNHINRTHAARAATLKQKRQLCKETSEDGNILEKVLAASIKRPKLTLTKELFRKSLINFIVSSNQPFRIVQNQHFQDFVRLTSQGHEAATLPSRTTIAADTEAEFVKRKEEIKRVLHDSPGKISFVIDGWTSSNQIPYLGVVARWIDSEWNLQSRLIDMVEVEGPHTGANICQIFAQTIDDYELWNKVHSITTDNASNLDTFFEQLEQTCTEKAIPIDWKNHRVRCMAHILNLVCKSIIASASPEDGKLETEKFDDSSDFVGKLRKAVAGIRSSPQRRKIFLENCKQFNVKQNMLILDVATRWNSTYDMMTRALELKLPLIETQNSVRELKKRLLSENDWDKIRKLSEILKPFKMATVQLSQDSIPTLNEVSAVYQVIFDHLEVFTEKSYGAEKNRRQKVKEQEDWISKAAEAGWEKLEKYYPTSDGDVYAVATILDPRLKLYWYKAVGWKKPWIDRAKKSITQIWNSKYRQCEGNEELSAIGETGDFLQDMFSQQMQGYYSKGDELSRYLSDGAANPEVMIRSGCKSVLGWWKVHQTEYPNLSRMARDYLAACGTGVPIERMFSAGPDLLDCRRQKLLPETIRMCLCLRSWMASSYVNDSEIKIAVQHKFGAESETAVIDVE